ncbi:cyclic pyranopterin monophosphate synthase MoaC [Bacillus atrophaeus]|uniref:cyclic pyranopterin monophosphate synthase MoaC n=1 Tax=Bacillus atrophaeus TaxID=1452 RepID=UPI0022814F81|nr:cyclic pyranopterin monophosphate synthase MoaC [Bacillus atrophaeus]MCY9204411.1 cyclic pyranopterin monophosphate synthase MoaC [Bacillus atrophaeus]MEC0885353.1 cyclic pyranopterin monophosphate synthase MoaC [Bacillus atrophaeus]MED4829909.1 cyclic pyranopterin monophosphate synthase MoaC [Bacillus atrophaeus]
MNGFSHFNEQGRAQMVDISEKSSTVRTAIAVSSVHMKNEVYEKIKSHDIGKGDVLAVAQVAGIMAAKQTSSIIPMCHPLSLSGVDISYGWENKESEAILHIQASVKTKGSTGVEMEALTSASVSALTVYDMCKALDKGMVIGPTCLLEKTGGKNGDFKRETSEYDLEDQK